MLIQWEARRKQTKQFKFKIDRIWNLYQSMSKHVKHNESLKLILNEYSHYFL